MSIENRPHPLGHGRRMNHLCNESHLKPKNKYRFIKRITSPAGDCSHGRNRTDDPQDSQASCCSNSLSYVGSGMLILPDISDYPAHRPVTESAVSLLLRPRTPVCGVACRARPITAALSAPRILAPCFSVPDFYVSLSKNIYCASGRNRTAAHSYVTLLIAPSVIALPSMGVATALLSAFRGIVCQLSIVNCRSFPSPIIRRIRRSG